MPKAETDVHMVHNAGGKLQPVQAGEEAVQPGPNRKTKVSRKERLQKKRDQKRAEREAGSDDDEGNKGASCSCMQFVVYILATFRTF